MTNEQMIEIAEQHFDYQGGWIANTEDLLKFARELYDDVYTKGFKVGHDAGLELNDEVSHRGL